MLTTFLRERGAELTTVAPYVYGNAADDATVKTLLERMANGEVDAIAFTSKLQIERLVNQQPAPLVTARADAHENCGRGPDRRRGDSRGGLSKWPRAPSIRGS